MFTDDVKIFQSIPLPTDLLKRDLNAVTSWCSLNHMQMNITKCNTMIFYRKYPTNTSYTINHVVVQRVESFVDLGVIFDPKLRFNLHIGCLIIKSMSILGCIKRWAKEFKGPYITKTLYVSLVRPIIEYAVVVWCPSYQCSISALERVEKQFLLFCLFYSPINNHYTSSLYPLYLPVERCLIASLTSRIPVIYLSYTYLSIKPIIFYILTY